LKITKTINAKFTYSSWTNSYNALVYKNMPLGYFKRGAIEGGLDNGCDVKAIINYIKNAQSILEVGAGYGRVLDYIVKSGFKGELLALEREPKLCKILKQQFKKVRIICEDIRYFKLNQKFDLIVWFWAGLYDFAKTEQLLTLRNLVSHLNSSGFLIFDLIPFRDKTINTIDLDRHNRIIPTPYGDDKQYHPSAYEIKHYIQQLDLQKKANIIYETKTAKKRNLYVLQKIK